MDEVIIDGSQVTCAADIHLALEAQLELGPYYGRNLAALWDRLSTDVSRPVRIIWIHSRVSRRKLGRRTFRKFVDLLAHIAAFDRELGLEDRLEFELR